MFKLISEKVQRIAELQQAAAYCRQGQGCNLTGLADSCKSVFLAALHDALGAGGSIAIIGSTREALRPYRRELAYIYPQLPMQELYPEEIPRVHADTKSLELQAGRTAALGFLQGEEQGIVFITAESLQQKQPGLKSLSSLTLTCGQEIDQEPVIRKLAEMGYERTGQVDAMGQFSIRGDILDVYPINSPQPLRIEWLDIEIDAIRIFNVDTQRSLGNLEEARILALKEEGDTAYTATVFDYCKENTLVIIDEPVNIVDILRKLDKENSIYREELYTVEELLDQCSKARPVVFSALGHSYWQQLPKLPVPVRKMAPYNKNINSLLDDLHGWLDQGFTPIIMSSSSIKARNQAANLSNYQLPGVYAEAGIVEGAVNVVYGDLAHGFRFWDTNWLLLTENDIYGMQKQKRFHSKHQGQQLQYFTDIKAGDYVVHQVHGIGRYLGVTNEVLDGIHRDYLLLAYANDDKLYVPVEQVGLLHKYVGSEGAVPRLSKMGGSDWKRVTTKAAKAVTELAEELLRLYAQRQIVTGHAFAPDNHYQEEFEEAFPYEETPDQLKAIGEIKADMEKPQPMERLLCGDVGYGKTEVAVRAAFKAIMDGKQVAVMVPTTVLAQQHYLTFKGRMGGFGVRVAMINRFYSPKEQKQILEDLAHGKIDLLIGTHRLLQQDVHFPDLGLLIIDEEQRFGVGQKEKLKKWCLGIDVLTLSATPIPRTLHLALVNGRDMSVIESPPEDRIPVETYVSEYSDGMIKEAIERELRRGGQVYYVHNRVSGLDAIAGRLKKLVPGITIKMGHGKMNEEMLEDAMVAFYEGQCDVLLCTTIVENGLDVPNANTIIIDGAENFGLSQLYQMRGRVGRSSRLAYAYFVYKPNRALSEIAQKRLQAIRDFTELGAGFKIAMRDLEIRGAGNILGSQQHGHIAGIGFAAYCKLLEETITRLKTGKEIAPPEPDPVLDLNVEAYIPNAYIEDPRFKMELYRRCADLEYSQREDFLDEIYDRFGNLPEEVMNLWRVSCVRSLCKLMGIKGITAKNNLITMVFGQRTLIDVEKVLALVEKDRAYGIKPGKETILTYKLTKSRLEPLAWLEQQLPALLPQEA